MYICIFKIMSMQITENVSLQPYNTFGIAVKAKRMVLLSNESDVREFASHAHRFEPYLIMGSGANLLFTRDFEGTVALVETKGVKECHRDAEHVVLQVEAGEIWDDFVRYCVEGGYYGVENLALIPSKVGSAVVQNIGAYGREVKDVVREVHAIDLKNGVPETFDRSSCLFGYRESLFKKHPGRYLITSVLFELGLVPRFYTEYGDVAAKLKEKGETSIQAVYEVVSEIRRSKLPDVKLLGNAGSFFKNPVVSAAQWEQLRQQFPMLKGFPQPDGRVKLSAAQLIDSLGWKGKRAGQAGVHEKQALVLVNYGGATGAEVLALARNIQADVKRHYGVELEMEVIVI